MWDEVAKLLRQIRKSEARANAWFILSIPPFVLSPVFLVPSMYATWENNQKTVVCLNAALICFCIAAAYRFKRRKCLVNLAHLQRLTSAPDLENREFLP